MAAKNNLIEKTRAAAQMRNNERLSELTAGIRRRMTAIVESFYDIGEALREILDRKLYGAAGHVSLQAFLDAEHLMSSRQARKLIAIVRRVPRPAALVLGQERAYALLSYTAATEAPDTVASFITDKTMINGKLATQASLREIQAAARTARAARRARRPQNDTDRERAREEAALTKATRDALRSAGIVRADITLGREHVRIVIARSQLTRLVAVA
jgi:hypothetical protein